MHGLPCDLLLLQGAPEAPLEGPQVAVLRLQGLQLSGHRTVSGGHQGPQARGDDHLRDSAGDGAAGGDHPSVPGLLQTCNQQISVSPSLTFISLKSEKITFIYLLGGKPGVIIHFQI